MTVTMTVHLHPTPLVRLNVFIPVVLCRNHANIFVFYHFHFAGVKSEFTRYGFALSSMSWSTLKHCQAALREAPGHPVVTVKVNGIEKHLTCACVPWSSVCPGVA